MTGRAAADRREGDDSYSSLFKEAIFLPLDDQVAQLRIAEYLSLAAVGGALLALGAQLASGQQIAAASNGLSGIDKLYCADVIAAQQQR